MTLWIVVFIDPAACSSHPCEAPADVMNPDTGADFFFVDGRVVAPSGQAMFAGRLRVGQTAGSGLAEVGGVAVPLSNPDGADVILALHSHGPAGTGDVLQAQLSSFLGGCETFLGPDGIADGPEDIPDAVGECSTFQYPIHAAP